MAAPDHRTHRNAKCLPLFAWCFHRRAETIFPDVKWIDTYRRGYLISTYTKEKVVSDWKFIDNINNMYYSESKPSHLETIPTEPEL